MEEKILSTLSGRESDTEVSSGSFKEIKAKEGQTVTLRCRFKSFDISWTMEPVSGEVETIQNESKKLRVLAGEDDN